MGANTQGLATLQMLNILENFDLRGMGFQSGESHSRAGGGQAAWRTRIVPAITRDPHFSAVPIEWLNSKAYAAERARLIRADRVRGRRLPRASRRAAAIPPTSRSRMRTA